VRIILFFIILSYSSILCAQETSKYTLKKTKPVIDTHYVKNYKDFLTIGIFITIPYNTLSITPRDSSIKPTTYKTNLASIIGFTAGYKSISFSIGFRAPIEAGKNSEFGKTYFKSFSIGTQKAKFSLGFDYRQATGFYNSDSLIYSASKKDYRYLKRGDVNTKQFMVSGLYNFSWKKYSYLSSFNFSEHQLRTRIGLLIKSSISTNHLKSDSSLINRPNATSISNGIQQLNYTSYVIGPGVGLNVVIARRVYFSMIVFLSYDYVTYKFIDNNNNVIHKNNSFTAFFEERIALGYHSKRFYAGLKFTADQIQVKTVNYNVGNKYGALTLDVGYRFNAPGILKKTYKATLTRFLGL
jgi:hypothetical protein